MDKKYECPFCYKIYGKAEEHDCEERKMWEKTLIGQATEARKALYEFSETIMKEAIKSRKALEKWVRTSGLSVRSKDDN